MPRPRSSCWLPVLALGAAGCSAEIGDECTSALDCSTLGERLCDSTQPGGYCTIFNCEPDTCPEEAACVAFQGEIDPACRQADDGKWARFGRTFCMRVCEEQDDCRSGYECVRPADRFARVLDQETDTDDPQETRVCLVAGAVPELPAEIPDACYPNAEIPDLVPYQPDGGAAGEAGAGGAGGAAGGGGSGGGGGVAGAGGGGQGGMAGAGGGAGG
ncbi:MAG: hypothetical protein HY744_31890 [Deltaproteobacteria bacterium]|nr:hypothetical protein [Deltaproteobacteria bacterium]